MPFLPFWLCLLTIIVTPIIYSYIENRREKKRQEFEHAQWCMSDYYKCTHLLLRDIQYDEGRWGEYKIYQKCFACVDPNTRFLFNLYVPLKEKTTEIDVLMISKYGIFIFESKNFSGWIFGDEQSKNWCETFPNGEKEFFYNPIWQNKSHLKSIKDILGDNHKYYPAVVFGENAELINVHVNSDVLTIYDIPDYLSTKCINSYLSDDEINAIYATLYPYTQASEQLKEKHIQNIQNNNCHY